MARIEPVELIINKGGSISTVIVKYNIRFSSLDVIGNVEYGDRLRLRGSDGGLTGDDDNLITLRNEAVQPNGQATLVRDFESQVANSVLNEDSFPRGDEIYARVTIQDVDGQFRERERDSNIVTGRF